jgi:hypothetical protein
MPQFQTMSSANGLRTTLLASGLTRTRLPREFYFHFALQPAKLVSISDSTVNPLTYASLKTLTEVHGKPAAV